MSAKGNLLHSTFVRLATHMLCLSGSLLLTSQIACAKLPPLPGYLPDNSVEADLSIAMPKAPDNSSAIGQMDLAMVKMAQPADQTAYVEAYNDAAAYSADQLMSRFSEAAGVDLSPAATPILAHILVRILVDTGDYANFVKHANGNGRERPYLEDKQIAPCETYLLRTTDDQSFLSGHATNGYAAALVLNEAIPNRTQPILARGIRYGMNRVVCGVHHPIDVEQGRLLAIAIVAALDKQKEFRDDVECAREEYLNSKSGMPGIPPVTAFCVALNAKYASEFSQAASQP